MNDIKSEAKAILDGVGSETDAERAARIEAGPESSIWSKDDRIARGRKPCKFCGRTFDVKGDTCAVCNHKLSSGRGLTVRKPVKEAAPRKRQRPDAIAEYRDLAVHNRASDYSIERISTGEEHGMGDGVDMLSDGDGNALFPDTPEFDAAMQSSLESGYSDYLEAYFGVEESVVGGNAGPEGRDVCSICGSDAPYGTMADIDPIEFDLACRRCRPDLYDKKGVPKRAESVSEDSSSRDNGFLYGSVESMSVPQLTKALAMVDKKIQWHMARSDTPGHLAPAEEWRLRYNALLKELRSRGARTKGKSVSEAAGRVCPRCGTAMTKHPDSSKAVKGYKNCPKCNLTYSPEAIIKGTSAVSYAGVPKTESVSGPRDTGKVPLHEDIMRADAPNSSSPSDLKRDYIQYIRRGNTFSPVGEIELVPKLESYSYHIRSTPNGLMFEKTKSITDQLYLFENSSMTEVLHEIEKFWTLKDNFDKLGYLHHRGILMYGPPGCGKSALIQQVSESMAKQGDIMLYAKEISTVKEGLRALRQVEPGRRAVVVLEDMDEYVNYSEHAVLQLLDGADSTDNILYLGTTNYIDRFPPRLLRPGRFDKKVRVDYPCTEGRLVYLRHKLQELETEDRIHDIARRTKGFSFGHLREFIIAAYAFKEPIDEVLRRLSTIDYTALPARDALVAESMIQAGKKRLLESK